MPLAQAGDKSLSREGPGKSLELSSQGPAVSSREREMVRFGLLGMGSQGPGGTLWPNTSLLPQPTHIFLPASPGRVGRAGSMGLFPP